MTQPTGLTAMAVDDIPPIGIGPGCTRRDLPARPGVRVWVVDMEPGATWPIVDAHDEFGEDVFVAAGTVIEGDQHYPAGTYLHFSANSSHRPRTETGVRLFGINLVPRA